MATVYKIHPAIGVARVGNSPEEFFVGPERVGAFPEPPGGFKDDQCRIKRQAARFRVFAHADDGTVTEVTEAEAAISWTVHLVNSKAAHPDRGNSEPADDLTIDPGPRTLTGPDQRAAFDTGTIRFTNAPETTVPLGEVRSTEENHLLVLGGFGHSASPAGTALDGDFWASDDWYDDVSDGPVTATITLRADGSTPPVAGAWVLVAPPKYAPDQDSVITLYDRITASLVEAGRLPAPTVTSYTHDVWPVLQRARDTGWVDQVAGAHTWADPVTADRLRSRIFNRLTKPGGSGGGNMPLLNDSGTGDSALTSVQYGHLERWKNGAYTADWAGVPAPQADVTADGLDRAALEACVGGSFFPGIEAGGRPEDSRPITDPANYAEPYRLDHTKLRPGALTHVMALPWQNDFYQCQDNWWPVPRPNYVVRGAATGQSFGAGVADSAEQMVEHWHRLGFVVAQGDRHVEIDRCARPRITLLTPVVNFQDVPQGPLGMVREAAVRIVFDVAAAEPVTLTLDAASGPLHPQVRVVAPTVVAGAGSAEFWLVYRTSVPGDALPPQTLTIREEGSSNTWPVTVLGNTVARRTTAAVLVLDRSAGMAAAGGDGLPKHVALRRAGRVFADLLVEGDGLGVVGFAEDARVLGPVLAVGAGGATDPNRATLGGLLDGDGLAPAGETSIGNGLGEAQTVLDAAPFDQKALVVVSGAPENRERFVADVADSVTGTTYAIGLGAPQSVGVPALQPVAENTGGYTLVAAAGDRFELEKYLLQVLAGVDGAEVVLGADGELLDGSLTRIPFTLSARDAGVDVILLTSEPGAVDFRVETPSGQLIEPWRAVDEPGMRHVRADGVSYYRIALPFEFLDGRFDQAGTWHVVLTPGAPRDARSDSRDGTDRSLKYAAWAPPPPAVVTGPVREARLARRAILAAEGLAEVPVGGATGSIPYSVAVHAYSALSFDAVAEQSATTPGARVTLTAWLTEPGAAVPPGQARVRAEVTRPDGRVVQVDLPLGDGAYAGGFDTAAPGVYRIRLRAGGTTGSGEAFTRERTLTAAVWHPAGAVRG